MKNKKIVIWLALLIIIICAIISLVFLSNRERIFQNNSNSANSLDGKESLSIKNFQPIQGTSTFIATVEQERDWAPNISGRWFSFDYGFSVRNLAFLDGNTLDSHYLFDTNENHIVDTTQFPSPNSYQEAQTIVIKWLVYQIIHGDTNSDNVINTNDSFSIAISNANGQNYLELIENVSAIYGMDLLDEHYLVVVYKISENYFASKIDLNLQSIVETKEVETIPSGHMP